MFTGIIETSGKILKITPKSNSKKFNVSYLNAGDLQTGESISVNGACQTVTEVTGQSFWVEAMQETLRRTNLDKLQEGQEVNLERSLRAADRISGHFVTGHVDVTGVISEIEVLPDSDRLTIDFPSQFSKYVAPKGSIAVNGISLTVIETSPSSFTVGIIPFTRSKTNLQNAKKGDQVNLEFDLIAKYLESLNRGKPRSNQITEDYLHKAGW